MTHLPASEEAFDKSRPHPTTSLEEAMKPGGATKLTPLGGVVLMACVIGRNLTHLHRPTSEDREDDLEGAFWQRHRELEGILTDVRLSLPDHLKLPAGLPDVNVIFLNMSIHTSAICLHQAAIFKADRFKLPANVGSECRVRCMAAAAEIAKIMRMLVHLDLSSVSKTWPICGIVVAESDEQCVDEPVRVIQRLRRSTRVRTIFEVPTERWADDLFSAVPGHRHASIEEEEPAHGLFYCTIGSRFGSCWHRHRTTKRRLQRPSPCKPHHLL